MVATSLCYGYWSECPKNCHNETPENSQLKCFVHRACYYDWVVSERRTGLSKLMEGN